MDMQRKKNYFLIFLCKYVLLFLIIFNPTCLNVIILFIYTLLVKIYDLNWKVIEDNYNI